MGTRFCAARDSVWYELVMVRVTVNGYEILCGTSNCQWVQYSVWYELVMVRVCFGTSLKKFGYELYPWIRNRYKLTFIFGTSWSWYEIVMVRLG